MADQSTQPQKEGGKKIRIQYYRSAIGFPEELKQMVRSLGFTKLNQIVERPDLGPIRGIVANVPHLLRIIE